jgi:hypothetical protein
MTSQQPGRIRGLENTYLLVLLVFIITNKGTIIITTEYITNNFARGFVWV